MKVRLWKIFHMEKEESQLTEIILSQMFLEGSILEINLKWKNTYTKILYTLNNIKECKLVKHFLVMIYIEILLEKFDQGIYQKEFYKFILQMVHILLGFIMKIWKMVWEFIATHNNNLLYMGNLLLKKMLLLNMLTQQKECGNLFCLKKFTYMMNFKLN